MAKKRKKAARKIKAKEGKMGLIAMVLGIVGLFVANIPIGILAMIIGLIALNKKQKYALPGVVLGIIDIVIGIIALTLFSMGLFS